MPKALFLDTSIHVDRVLKELSPERMKALGDLLESFDSLATCAYSRLEFKRVVIQDLALLLNYLVKEQSYFGLLVKITGVGARRPRRAATLTSIAAWVGLAIDKDIEAEVGEGIDIKLAIRAESYIRNSIPFLWRRFDRSVSSIFDRAQCRRAAEAPVRCADDTFDVTIHESRCRNKECNNANFFRENLPRLRGLRDLLQELANNGSDKMTPELRDGLEQLTIAIDNPASLYDYNSCVKIGDIWIHLECLAAGIRDFATKNYKESQVLCPAMGLTMRKST